jgi:hypothetical protein
LCSSTAPLSSCSASRAPPSAAPSEGTAIRSSFPCSISRSKLAPPSPCRSPRSFLHSHGTTLKFFPGFALAFLELAVAIFGLLSEVFVEVGDFLVFEFEFEVGVVGEGEDGAVEVVSGFVDLMVELVLEGEEGVVGAFGLGGDVLLAALDFPGWGEGYLSMSWKCASSCFFHSSLFFFMN